MNILFVYQRINVCLCTYSNGKGGVVMKRDLNLWQFAGFALCTLSGTLLHFLYDWTHKSLLLAPVSGVNESTWEHMKLLFFPLFFFALIQSRYFKDQPSFWHIKLIGIIVGLIAIPILFYTYNGVFGKSPDWVNITIFFIAAAVAFFAETKLFKSGSAPSFPQISFFLLCLIGVSFVVFTFVPPRSPRFRDPINGTYGI